MDAWLSSTGISHHDLLPHLPLICLSTVNSSPQPGITPHSPNSSSSCCAFQGTHIPVWGMYGYSKDCLIFIPFRLPQISCFTLSLKCFSSDSDNCPDVGIRPLLQFPPSAKGMSSLSNIPVSPPRSFVLLSFCVVLYILFCWSGTPVDSELVFCMHFCI